MALVIFRRATPLLTEKLSRSSCIWRPLYTTSACFQISHEKKTLLKENMRKYLTDHYYCLRILELRVFPAFTKGESFTTTPYTWNFLPVCNETNEQLGIMSKTLFWKGYEAIEKYISDEDEAYFQNPDINAAFAALERFFENKEKEEARLEGLLKKNFTETDVTCILTKHFLSQLLPHPSNYFLDQYSKNIPDGCPCGCLKPVQFGLTHLGSPKLFHGRVDVVLFPTDKDLFNTDNGTSAVFTHGITDGEKNGHIIMTDSGCVDDLEPEDCDISTAEAQRNNLKAKETKRQMQKQAIAVSLCKKRKLLDYEGRSKPSMMPVCGISKKSYSVTVYDADNDYLLSTFDELPLFTGMSLQFSAIIDMWFIINHGLFCKPKDDTLCQLKGSCNLVSHLGREKFDSIVQSSRWLYQFTYTQDPDDSDSYHSGYIDCDQAYVPRARREAREE